MNLFTFLEAKLTACILTIEFLLLESLNSGIVTWFSKSLNAMSEQVGMRSASISRCNGLI